MSPRSLFWAWWKIKCSLPNTAMHPFHLIIFSYFVVMYCSQCSHFLSFARLPITHSIKLSVLVSMSLFLLPQGLLTTIWPSCMRRESGIPLSVSVKAKKLTESTRVRNNQYNYGAIKSKTRLLTVSSKTTRQWYSETPVKMPQRSPHQKNHTGHLQPHKYSQIRQA